ncbi:glycosyltransferase family 87 protein [Acidicapsa acidisoli]|uniref:glycosyltransferase family 87 protein n=1 Tax=Acidicapsa acidisoli TaxID=1615681 RepID=UPI0021E02B0A|nr:glycosyltransferase family 87 protein [Acidicapsa acidisoli]
MASSPASEVNIPTKSSPRRRLAAACIVVAGACLVASILFFGMTEKSAANRDFIEYWAAGQQLIHGANPYDGAAILRLERAVGFDGNEPKIAPNPPVASFLVLPLGFVGAKAGVILWSIALLASISVANWILWILNGRPDNRLHLLGYLFAPVLACQMAGQIGTFLLVGIVLFLLLHDSRPFLAGSALLPCALKPHLFLPFAVVLLFWAVDRRVLRIFAGFAVTLLASCALTLCFNAQVWPQYSEAMSQSGLLKIYVPTLSETFRFLVWRDAVWLQFLPAACGGVWAIWYFWTRRSRWNWNDQGLMLLLVSALCAPYSWLSDEAILLPAVLAGLYRALNSGRSVLPLALFGGAALIEVLSVVKMTSPFYLWTVPAWFAWYLYAVSTKNSTTQVKHRDRTIPLIQ